MLQQAQTKDWLKLNGKEIQAITWADTETEKGQKVACTPMQKLVLCAEYLGDRTETWVALIRDGNEIARYNARMIESILWV
jgi:hypothetical protein